MENHTSYKKVASHEAVKGDLDTCLLLYSGGLDTPVMLKWIQEEYGCAIVALTTDLDFLDDVFDSIDKNPLGSTAGFCGSPALDRNFIARELEFVATQINSLYCQTGRGKFECMFLFAFAQVMQTLNSIASDLILFTSREFDFFSINGACVTGSSMMPQKKNTDGLEVIRAQCSVVPGYQFLLSDIAHNLISGYHRDFQVREAYFKAYEQRDDSSTDPKENIRSKISIGVHGNLMLDYYAERLRRRKDQ